MQQLRKKTVSSQPVNAASIIGSLLEEGILTDNAQPNSTTEFPCVNGASVGQSTPSESVSDVTYSHVICEDTVWEWLGWSVTWDLFHIEI